MKKYGKMFKMLGVAFLLIVLGFITIFTWKYIKSNKEYTFEFTRDEFGKTKDGIMVKCVTPDDKVWENNQAVSEYKIGAQYDFYIQNDTDYKFIAWGGDISIPGDWEIDSYWNFEYEQEEKTIDFKAVGDNIDVIRPGADAKVGCVINSNELLKPQKIMLHGYFGVDVWDIILFKVLVCCSLIWIGTALSMLVLNTKQLEYLQKQMYDAQIIKGLASIYSTVMVVSFEDGSIELYNSDEAAKYLDVGNAISGGYDAGIEFYSRFIVDYDNQKIKDEVGNLEKLRDNLEKNGNLIYRYQVEKNKDEEIYFEAVYVMLEDKKHCAIMFKNVDTEKKKELRYQTELRNAVIEADKANKSKSDFLARTSHEIRTPMNAIVGMTDIIAKGELDEEQKKYLSVIKSSGHALLEIINDILNLAKAESGTMELNEAGYSLRKLLDELQLLLQTRTEGKDLLVQVNIDEKLPELLYGDELKLRQIIINLANNAIKYTREGNVVLGIFVEKITEQDVKFKVSVKDTGIGIKDEDKKKLFDAFSQVDVKKNREIEGTGLGLSIAKQMVELMGGRIQVESTYGEGSEFYFVIAQKIYHGEEIKEDTVQVQEISIDEDLYTGNILVVDDNEINLDIAKFAFEQLGMKVEVADSGEKAFEMAEDTQYDIIFMDQNMPGMDGVETMKKIKSSEVYSSRDYKTPFIALTADGTDTTRDMLLGEGMKECLLKPIEIEKAKQVIRKILK